jgi:thymidylate synthase
MENNFEIKYKALLNNIILNNDLKENRTAEKAYSFFGANLSHNLQEGFPMLTGKKMFLKNIGYELIWFLNGDTNIKFLNNNNVTIWDLWADANGDLGPVYGHQLRNFNNASDQLKNLIKELKTNPNSRRHVVSLWDPCTIDQQALPPCYPMFQFYVNKNNLYLNVFIRSSDAFVGLPYDIAFFSLLLIIISKEVKLIPSIVQFNITDCHIYQSHLNGVNEYLKSNTYDLPTMEYLGNLNSLQYSDFNLKNYTSNKFIKVNILK